MHKQDELQLLFYFTAVYIVVFTLVAYYYSNYEFMLYTLILGALLFIIVKHHDEMHLTVPVMLGNSLFGLFHMLGGNLYINGIRLYDFPLVTGLIRYDQFVHFFGAFMVVAVSYNLLLPHLDAKVKHHSFLLGLLLVLIAGGIGVFNELLELLAVIVLHVGPQVGDYLNNTLDLLYNTLGSVVASIFVISYHRK